jgi:hypothetical protein
MRPAGELEDLKAEKRQRLQKAHIIETDEARRIQLEQQIADLEQ